MRMSHMTFIRCATIKARSESNRVVEQSLSDEAFVFV